MKLFKENFEDRSEKEQLFDVYSDIYKEKKCVRPHGIFSQEEKENLSIEDLNKLIDQLKSEPSYDEIWGHLYNDDENDSLQNMKNSENEVAPPGGEKLVKALKKQPGVKNPWAIAWSKYNKGELEENNKVTIGQLRQIIREELLKLKK